MKQRKNSFRSAITRSVLIVVVVVTVFILIINVIRDTYTLFNERRTYQALLSDAISESIREPLLQGAFIEVANRARYWMRAEEIECVTIHSPGYSMNECEVSDNTNVWETTSHENKILFSEQGMHAAIVRTSFDNTRFWRSLVERLIIDLFLFILLLGLAMWAIAQFSIRIQYQLDRILSGLRSKNIDESGTATILELHEMERGLISLIEAEKRSAQIQLLGKVARQVSHDIRSPLSALNVAVSTLNDQDLSRRALILQCIDRINGIADDLLKKSRENKQTSSPEGDLCSIGSAVKAVIREKRAEFQHLDRIKIEEHIEDTDHALTRQMSLQLQRVISNLINNSVESFEESGVVTVKLAFNNDFTSIDIKDDGPGIPSSILEKLGAEQISYGTKRKGSGNGLGLLHAKETIESLPQGTFRIHSVIGKGTKVTLFFKSTLPLKKD